ncbi:hypothetical protein ACO0QE_000665 [Hanseniaspora vineae]
MIRPRVSVLRKALGKSIGQTRNYQVSTLSNLAQIEASKTGIPGLFSAEGLENAWDKRALYHIENLNLYSSKVDQIPLSKIVKQYTNNPNGQLIYNHASIYQNLEFAISSVNIHKTELTQESNPLLLKLIQKSFNSLEEFKTLLINSSYNIQGDGFTWLMLRRKSEKIDLQASFTGDFVADVHEILELCIVNTYNAGSPNDYLEKSAALQKKLSNLSSNQNSQHQQQQQSVSSNRGMFLSVEEAQQKYYTDEMKKTQFIPLLAIDSSPKTWLTDYGVFGKREYLSKLWDHVNWNLVEERLPQNLQHN